MSRSRPYIGPSESQSQANADALANRGRTYAVASETSFRVKWDFHRREPESLREAVRMARKAYADEVPTKLHDSDIGEDGTPRMSARAEGYIFGNPQASDAGPVRCTCHAVILPPDEKHADYWHQHGEDCALLPKNRDIMSFYLAPFRATLAGMEHGDEASRKRAAIVSHVTIGSQGPKEAAVSEGVPSWCAGLVAFDALAAFLRRLTDVKLDIGKEAVA